MKHKFLFLIFLVIRLSAQENTSLPAGEILQALHKLNGSGNVLYIAAHPDDENTRLLSFLVSEKKYRAAYLSLTRGDGGQNLIGKEQGPPLGLIRTNELMAARRTDGAEQFFTRANDFGYSKNPEETFNAWNRDSVLSDVVLVIRKFRPDLIICRFPTTGEGGHGHHTASAMLALEAFDAAADPTRFAWQLKHYPAWKTCSIVWNTFNFGSTNTTAPDQLQVDVGGYNKLLGKSYGEIASESRSMHKSQGFGSARQRGSATEFFKFLRGDSLKTNLFDHVGKHSTIVWDGLKECIDAFDVQQPEKSIPALVSIFKKLNLSNADPSEKEYKKKELQRLILACAGVWLEATAAAYTAIPGKDLQFSVQAIVRSNHPVKLSRVHYPFGQDTLAALPLKPNAMNTFKRQFHLPDDLPYSGPYWLKERTVGGLYTVKDPLQIGRPLNDPALTVTFDLEIDGFEFNIERSVVYKTTDPVKGEVYRPLEVLPPVIITFPERTFAFNDTRPRTIPVVIHANAAGLTGKLELSASLGWSVTVKNPTFALTAQDEEVTIEAVIVAEKNAPPAILTASALIDNKRYGKGITRIEYDHIPYQFILNNAEVGLVYVDMTRKAKRIGYIPGAGDEVMNCLKQVGYEVTELTDAMLSGGDLSSYDAIVTGVRAYNTNQRLPAQHARLMSWVKNGGNLIVQYNTNSRVGPLQTNIGPWPFTISRDRVTDEKAPVTFLNAAHPALNKPNKIVPADFDGWVQERGIYFATGADKQYETILAMNDPGEKPMEGSLIIGKYGKGNFVYTGLVFFRQLPAGVPGAYRLFANLIDLPRNKD